MKCLASCRAFAHVVIAVFAFLGVETADAFVDNVHVEPTHPTAGRPVTLVARAGECHGFPSDGKRTLEREGNRLRVLADGLALAPGNAFCILPTHELRFELGALEPGNYEIELVLVDATGFAAPIVVGTVVFGVIGPSHIPARSRGSLVLLAMLVAVVGAAFFRSSRPGSAYLLLLFAAGPAFAGDKQLHILLKADEAALSPEDLVEPYEFSSLPEEVVSVFMTENPSGFAYLVPERARGRYWEYLALNPTLPRSRLERYVVATYPAAANLSAAITALSGEYSVEFVHVAPSNGDVEIAPPSGIEVLPWKTWSSQSGVEAAWSIAGGWGLVGALDNGLDTDHDDLRAFGDDGRYLGGGFLPAISADAGRSGFASCHSNNSCVLPNVDEREPLFQVPGSVCDPDGDGWAIPARAGHGTHVAGLIAANASNADGIHGSCRHCGLAAWRISFEQCFEPNLFPYPNAAAMNATLPLVADLGVQVVNQSSGLDIIDPTHCNASPLASHCLAIAHLAGSDVLHVAAAGNDRGPIEFPASDERVLAAGGAGKSLSLWDRGDQGAADCPAGSIASECGSNYTRDPVLHRRQELLAPAEDVYSIFYPGAVWNSKTVCSDAADGGAGDGAGVCTGTSMAAPIIAGIAGLLRSINPLVHIGQPNDPLAPAGIRSVLRQATFESKLGKAWDARLGFGRVEASSAAAAMLGYVGGTRMRNRAIPLFALESTGALDHAAVATPQLAVSIGLTKAVPWSSRGKAIVGYPSFPLPNLPADLAPKASAFVLSTEHRTRSMQSRLAPLFLLDRPRPWPLGCTPGVYGCVSFHNDHLLVSTVADLEKAHADGYRLLGRQGYVFARCAPEPACIPSGSAKLYRQCKPGDDDCAVFIESEKLAFEANGYTVSYPAGSDAVLGYAFPNVDADGDTLVDGFERMIGTNPAAADSDGDGAADGVEYPLAGVPVSDPCSGVINGCNPPAFFDGFE